MPRGRLTERPAQAPRRASNGNGHRYTSIGHGPPCPDNHGPLYDWGPGRWFCSHSAHGGNGKFFHDHEVN